jgi:hypothetical protein
MSFAEAIKTCFKKYADFGGRAPRPEFWWFVLFYYLVILLLVVPLIAIHASSVNHAPFEEPGSTTAGVVFGVLVGVALLALLIPYLAAGHWKVRVVVVDLARSLRLDRPHRIPRDRGESRLESVRAASRGGPPGDAVCDDTAATASSV